MKNTSSGLFWWIVLASLRICHTAAVAQQDVFGNALTNNFQSQSNNFASQQPGPTTPGSGQFGAPYMGTSSLPGSSAATTFYVPTGPPLEQWGPLGFYPHLLYSLTYGNGIQAQPGKNSTTAINTVAPGAFLKIGGHWSIDYTLSRAIYSNPIFRDTTDHHVILTGVTTNGDWTLKLSQSYIDTTAPLVETGTQTEQEAYATALNAAWQMNDKMSLQLGLNQNFRFAQSLSDLHEWSTSDWLNYQFEPQFGAGLGLTGGYDEVSLGSDMPFEQILGRVVFQPGTKLSLILVGGGEDRQFLRPAGHALVSPIFDASLCYQILRGTLLTISGRRTVTPSLEGGEINTITSVTAALHQDIAKNMYFEISGGYTSEPFTSIAAGPLPKYFFGAPPRTPLQVTRADTRTFVEFTLATTFRARLTGSVFYRLIASDSSQANFNYSGNQVGLELNYRY
jgi:hypothetical protein